MLSQLFQGINFGKRKFTLDRKQLMHDLEGDADAYLKLKDWFKERQIEKQKLVIYSPGAGSDMLTLLAVYDALVSGRNREATIVFLDFRDFFEGAMKQLLRYTRGAKVSIKRTESCHVADIHYKDKLIRLVYHVKDFSNFYPPELEDGIDIYYERAFEMFRTSDNIAMSRVYRGMRKGGLMISDYGFALGSYSKNFRKLKAIPKGFGLYQHFQIWQRMLKD